MQLLLWPFSCLEKCIGNIAIFFHTFKDDSPKIDIMITHN